MIHPQQQSRQNNMTEVMHLWNETLDMCILCPPDPQSVLAGCCVERFCPLLDVGLLNSCSMLLLIVKTLKSLCVL